MKKLLVLIALFYAQLAGAQPGLLKMTGPMKVGERGIPLPSGFDPRFNQAVPVLNSSVEGSYPVSDGLHIFHWTKAAHPGDYIFAQGYFPANAELCLVVNDNSRYITLPIIQQGANIIQARIPAVVLPGVYQIFVKSGSIASAVQYINKPIGYSLNSPQVYSGADMALAGKNLKLEGAKPVIRFVRQSNGAVSYGAYVPKGSSAYKVNFKAPLDLVVGEVYQVYYSNGYGGSIGETLLEEKLTAIAPAPDFYSLGVAYHANFTKAIYENVYDMTSDSRLTAKIVAGDETTNYRDAIQAAIDKASADGGGVVKLPKGTYRVTGTSSIGLTMKSNVILEGAGQDATKLVYSGFTTRFLYADGSRTTVGLANLWLVNQNTEGSAAQNSGAGTFNSDHFFIVNVRWEIGIGGTILIQAADKVAIKNLIASQTKDGLMGPLRINSCNYATMVDSETYGVRAVQFSDAEHYFLERNKFFRDISIPIIEDDPATTNVNEATIHHVITNDFFSHSYVGQNQFLVCNGQISRIIPWQGKESDPNGHLTSVRNNDGESIICEGGGANPPYLYKGTITSATATSFTDSGQNFTTLPSHQAYVSIIDGKGTGQVRAIKTRTSATTLEIDKPWDVTPDASSVYVTYCFALEYVVYFDNYFENQQRGITIYKAAIHDVDIVDNTLINSGAIDIQPTQNTRSSGTVLQLTPVYDVDLINNKADATADPWKGCSMGLQLVQNQLTDSWGTAVIGLRMKDNTIKNNPENNQLVVVDQDYNPGYNAYMEFLRQTSKGTDPTTYFRYRGAALILGTIIQDCIVQDCTRSPVTLGTGTFYTLIINLQKLNSGTTTVIEKKPSAAAGEPAHPGSQFTLIQP
ncbi:glycosyl hydrolase family 28-related protein [Larkinella arboricola]